MRIQVWYARQLIMALAPSFTVAAAALGQAIPHLDGAFEKLWTDAIPPSWLEGPAFDGAGAVWFTNLEDTSGSSPTSVLRHDVAAGTTAVMFEDRGGANGLAFDHQGRLLAAMWHGGSLTRRPVDDLTNVTVVADNWNGTPLKRPNDLTVASDGGIYFTDQNAGAVYYVNPAGELSRAATPGSNTNGIELSPGGETLYVTRDMSILSFDVQSDGTLTNQQVFAAPGRFLDGLTVDRFGNVYAPTALSLTQEHVVRVWNSAGQPVFEFVPPELAINATFAPGDMLYLTTRTSLYRVPITFTLPGDLSADGNVDAADYVLWRKNDGTPAAYETWRANFGASIDPAVSTGVLVPEPASGWLIMLGIYTLVSFVARRGVSSRRFYFRKVHISGTEYSYQSTTGR